MAVVTLEVVSVKRSGLIGIVTHVLSAERNELSHLLFEGRFWRRGWGKANLEY